ncbi:MAG: SsrA-binding protein SmpB [Myxococcota bacterium]|jgi:SsrA-binding protein|nr:SsrA-binding protein SmpB [Myxococcota bacterium]
MAQARGKLLVGLVASNRRALHDYEILEKVEAGLVLLGPEVKSLREGRANLSDSYAVLRRGEAYLVNAHVSPYAQASRENPDPRRERKLLLNRSEIQRLAGKVAERGLTLVPLSLYFKNGRAKVELGLARGKRVYDKRQTLKRREQEREIERAVRDREDT